MSKIYLFRGKAATGKTLITNALSNLLRIPVFRKDDIYDELSKHISDHIIKNNVSYDILARTIQANINNKCDLIIDISLPHNPYLEQFLSKIDFKDSKLNKFLCICSNNEVWRNRIEERVKNPSPNQIFKSAQEAEEHYNKYDTFPMQYEIVIDSIENIEDIIQNILETFNK